MQPTKQSTPRSEFENMPGGLGHDDQDKKTSPSDLASRGAEKAQELATAAGQKASSVAEKAKETARDAANKAGEMAKNVGHKAEDAVSSVGGQMKSLAGTIREKAPHEGIAGSTATAVANTLDSSGAYLQQHNLSGMAEDMTDLIRRYPIQSLLVGIGVGFLLAKATRS
jgi:ElaB/YqjD/DUF883 family membrane-anchored ribosome-binding protein